MTRRARMLAGACAAALALLAGTAGAAAAPYSIPPGNPFASTAGAKPEIWAYGLRNPWRFSFDRATGDLVIGDVGQSDWEEVDFAPLGSGAGANYGWNCREGLHPYAPASCDPPNRVDPVFEYPHGTSACSITGGYVVRDASVPALAGRYVYGDWCTGELRSLQLGLPSASDDQPLGVAAVASLSSFGQDAAGHVYALSGSGPVYRIDQAGGGVKLTRVTSTNFAYPTYLVSPPGDATRLFVVERRGTIRLVQNGQPAPDPFLDIRARVEDGYLEQGLLSMAFAPDFATSGRFFVYFTNAVGDPEIDELHVAASDPAHADLASERTILTIPHPGEPNHNGGQLQFGPDGYLYAGIGDGGGEGDPNGNAQSLSTLLGKLIRIDVSEPAAPAPGGGANGGGGGVARDTTPPRTRIFYARRQRILRRHHLSLAVRTSERARVRVTGAVRAGGRKLRLRSATRTIAAGIRARFHLRASRATVRRLRAALRAHRRLVAHVTVAANDAAGNRVTLRRSIRIAR